MATFILLALGSIYELQVLTFGSLITLMVGLFFGKEALEAADIADVWESIDPEDDIDGLTLSDDVHLADVCREDDK